MRHGPIQNVCARVRSVTTNLPWVATLHFSPAAERAYRLLDADPTAGELLDRVDRMLDLLEADPGDVRVRQRRFAKIGAWGIVVRDRHADLLIIWEPSPTRPLDVNVDYIGTDPFS
jgi:hypothetical protein